MLFWEPMRRIMAAAEALHESMAASVALCRRMPAAEEGAPEQEGEVGPGDSPLFLDGEEVTFFSKPMRRIVAAVEALSGGRTAEGKHAPAGNAILFSDGEAVIPLPSCLHRSHFGHLHILIPMPPKL